MAKLYVFGIGGTGARVVKSLTMLLASGIKTSYDIVPILIDPDRAGGDLNRTVKVLRDYQLIQKEIKGFDQNHFFNNGIITLSEIILTEEETQPLLMDLDLNLTEFKQIYLKSLLIFQLLTQTTNGLQVFCSLKEI